MRSIAKGTGCLFWTALMVVVISLALVKGPWTAAVWGARVRLNANPELEVHLQSMTIGSQQLSALLQVVSVSEPFVAAVDAAKAHNAWDLARHILDLVVPSGGEIANSAYNLCYRILQLRDEIRALSSLGETAHLANEFCTYSNETTLRSLAQSCANSAIALNNIDQELFQLASRLDLVARQLDRLIGQSGAASSETQEWLGWLQSIQVNIEGLGDNLWTLHETTTRDVATLKAISEMTHIATVTDDAFRQLPGFAFALAVVDQIGTATKVVLGLASLWAVLQITTVVARLVRRASTLKRQPGDIYSAPRSSVKRWRSELNSNAGWPCYMPVFVICLVSLFAICWIATYPQSPRPTASNTGGTWAVATQILPYTWEPTQTPLQPTPVLLIPTPDSDDVLTQKVLSLREAQGIDKTSLQLQTLSQFTGAAPVGIEHNGIYFDLTNDRSVLQTESLELPNNPSVIRLVVGVDNVLRVHFLINMSYGATKYTAGQCIAQMEVAQVHLAFDQGTYAQGLEAGKHIREWICGVPNVVSTAPATEGALWSGFRHDYSATIDHLVIDVSEYGRGKRLEYIDIMDSSRDACHSINPGILVFGVTIESAK